MKRIFYSLLPLFILGTIIFATHIHSVNYPWFTSDAEIISDFLGNLAALMFTIYIFGMGFITFLLELTLKEIELVFEDLKNDPLFTGFSIYYLLSIIYLIFTAASVDDAVIINTANPANQKMAFSGILVFLAGMVYLVSFAFRTVRYYGFISLLELMVEKINTYFRKMKTEAEANQESVNISSILDFTSSRQVCIKNNGIKKQKRDEVYLHENDELRRLMQFVEKIIISSEYVRSDTRTIKSLKKMLIIGTSIGISSKDYQQCEIKAHDPHLGVFREEWTKQLNLYREKFPGDPVVAYLMKQPRGDAGAYFAYNVFIEDWLYDFWTNIFNNIDDYHFFTTILYNHRRWFVDWIKDTGFDDENTYEGMNLFDFFAMYFLWIRVLAGLLVSRKEIDTSTRIKFNIILDNLIVPLATKGEYEILRYYMRSCILGLIKYLTSLNRTDIFEMIDIIYRKLTTFNANFIIDMSKNIYTMYIYIINQLYPHSLNMLPPAITGLFDILKDGDIDIFCAALEREMNKITSNKHNNERERLINTFLMILLVKIVAKAFPDNVNIEMLHKKYESKNILDKYENDILRILEQLKEIHFLNPELFRIEEQIRNRYGL